MGAYSYRALNETGKTVKGILEGDSERQVRTQLRTKKLKPLEVVSVTGKQQKTDDLGLGFRGWRRRRGSRLNTRDLSLITRQLASLVKSGLPLDEALHATAKQQQKQNVKQVILQVRTKVLVWLRLWVKIHWRSMKCTGRWCAPVKAPVTLAPCSNVWRTTPKAANRYSSV